MQRKITRLAVSDPGRIVPSSRTESAGIPRIPPKAFGAGANQWTRSELEKPLECGAFRRFQFAAVSTVFLLLASGLALAAAQSSIIADGAHLEKLAGDFVFAEGPASDQAGNVFFTDQPNDRIMEWTVDGRLRTFLKPCGRANGLSFDRNGNLWACADERNQLWRIKPDRTVTVVVQKFEGRLLNGPNDVWIRPDGGLYFTDPLYKRPYWKRGPTEQPCEGVYFLDPTHEHLTRVVSDLVRPNGIIGTPNGSTLYVADIDGKKTYRYRIQQDGSLSDKTFFCDPGSDGMTIDNAGNVYLTGDGVMVFDSTGQKIEHIPVPEAWTGNVCFGGQDHQTLFITASKGLYALKMRVKGVDSQ